MSIIGLGRNKRNELLRVYKAWRDRHKLVYSVYVTIAGLVSMLLLIPFDAVFIKGGFPYFYYRVAGSLLLVLNFMFISLIGKIQNESLIKILSSAVFLFPILLWTVMLHVFVFVLPQYNHFVYFMGLMLIGIFGALAFYRFWREQYFYSGFCAISDAVVGLIGNDFQRQDACILLIANVIACIAAIYHRRQFVSSLYDRYNFGRMFMPQQVSFLMATSEGFTSLESTFSPKNRYVVCICSDWRGFQKLCESKSPSEISHLLEVYYNIVLFHLEKVSSSGNYYVNWTADELFVIFFNDENNVPQVVGEAMNFVHTLGTEVFKSVSSTFPDVVFDIGVSSGVGLIGMQGPSFLKKTTVIGEVPGVAKRLEQEAKKIRGKDFISPPHIVVDLNTYENIQSTKFIFKFELAETISTEKDIKGRRCFILRFADVNDLYKLAS